MSSSDRVQRDAQVIRFNLEHFGDQIRTCRRNLGMTQEDLARALNIPKSNVSNWERGWSRPDLTLVPELCRMLHLSFETHGGDIIGVCRTESHGYETGYRDIIFERA